MKFTVTKLESPRDGVAYIGVCDGCGAKIATPHIRSQYASEAMIDSVSIHWSSTHSPRAREIAGT